LTLKKINGPLIYISNSDLEINNNSYIGDLINAERESPLIQVDKSVIEISNTLLQNISQYYYSPIISMSLKSIVSKNLTVIGIDKTLFLLE
jgi:hypothetical protein